MIPLKNHVERDSSSSWAWRLPYHPLWLSWKASASNSPKGWKCDSLSCWHRGRIRTRGTRRFLAKFMILCLLPTPTFSNSGGLKSRTARSPFSTVPIFSPRVLLLMKANLRQESWLSLGQSMTFPVVYGILNLHFTYPYQDHSSLTCESDIVLVCPPPSIF